VTWLVPVKRRDRLTDLTLLFWLGFSVATLLSAALALVYFLIA